MCGLMDRDLTNSEGRNIPEAAYVCWPTLDSFDWAKAVL